MFRCRQHTVCCEQRLLYNLGTCKKTATAPVDQNQPLFQCSKEFQAPTCFFLTYYCLSNCAISIFPIMIWRFDMYYSINDNTSEGEESIWWYLVIIGDKGMSIIDRHLKEGPSYSQHTVSKEVIVTVLSSCSEYPRDKPFLLTPFLR